MSQANQKPIEDLPAQTETRRRILAGLCLLAASLIALDWGGWWFWGYILLIQLGGAVELVGLLWPTPYRPAIWPALLVWLAATSSFLGLYRPSLELISWTLFLGPAYDTAAFVVGRLWGRHRLPSAISQNKTWEGCIGGMVGGTSLSLLFYWRLHSLTDGTWQVAHPIAIALAATGAALLADLLTSWLKRQCQAKDSGWHQLIRATGHGGFVDRFFAPAAAASVLLFFLTIASPSPIFPH